MATLIALLILLTLIIFFKYKPEISLYLIAFGVPLYLLRLKIFFIPVTLLEIIILAAGISCFVFNFKKIKNTKEYKYFIPAIALFFWPVQFLLYSLQIQERH